MKRDDMKRQLDEAWNEAHFCDYINLDQPLASIIADLEKDRTKLHRQLLDATSYFVLAREYLHIIAKNTCCDGCREAARVAQEGLAKMGELQRDEYSEYLAEGATVIR